MATRDKSFQVRVSAAEKAEIQQRAEDRGLKLSEYVRQAALGEAQPLIPRLVVTDVTTPDSAPIEAEPVLALPDPSTPWWRRRPRLMLPERLRRS